MQPLTVTPALLEKHKDWLEGAESGRANLRRANLSGADLSRAHLSEANLRGADLRGADLRGADLSRAHLSEANLSRANLSRADLSRADLRGADLRGADLRGADLRGADLSGATGLLDPIAYLRTHFERSSDGVIVYKQFNLVNPAPAQWMVEPGSVLTEVVSPDRCVDCACGINVATRDWCRRNGKASLPLWRCLIRWEWLAGVVVPYHTNGKIRASMVELLEIVLWEASTIGVGEG